MKRDACSGVPVIDTESAASSAQEQPLRITADMLAPAAPRDDRVELESGMSRLPPVTLTLIAVMVAVFVWEMLGGVLKSEEAIVAGGALVRARILAGEIWRLMSSVLLHASPQHLLGNIVALYITGMTLEHLAGKKQALLVFLLSGLTGALLSIAMAPGPSVGASGAIFGVLGTALVTMYLQRDVYKVRDKRIMTVMAAWAVYQIAIGFVAPLIDNSAHIGGLVGGMLIALMLRPRLAKRPVSPD